MRSVDEDTQTLACDQQDQAKAFVPVAPGSYSSAAVIMLTMRSALFSWKMIGRPPSATRC